MPQGQIKESNTRVCITIPKNLNQGTQMSIQCNDENGLKVDSMLLAEQIK